LDLSVVEICPGVTSVKVVPVGAMRRGRVHDDPCAFMMSGTECRSDCPHALTNVCVSDMALRADAKPKQGVPDESDEVGPALRSCGCR
jgi:hypothetical protein